MRDAIGRSWQALDSWRGDSALAAALVVTLLLVLSRDGLLNGSNNDFQAARAIGVCGCIAGRRAHPVWVACAAAVLLGIAGAPGSPADLPFSLLFIPVFLLAYSLGADVRLGPSVLALALLAAGLQLAVAQFNPFVAIITIGPWAAGLAVRSRHRLTEQLAARGRELEAERELFAAESVRYERARIARELHDIVAHCVSVMVIQAGAGQRLAVRDPSMAAQAFDYIGEAAQQAETEIGRLIELLSDDWSPPSGDKIQQIGELVARAAATGLSVSRRIVGSVDGLAPDTSDTCYRLVQESLTNALKHAPGAPVAITVDGQIDHIRIIVASGRPVAVAMGLDGAGGRHGLAGMRERVAAVGGELSAGPSEGCGWLVEARLPRRHQGLVPSC
jgi:signal transduction histidine kinase